MELLADVALAVSWAFFSGPTRYLSLATGAFFGAGAYGAALALRHVSFSLWAALLIGIAAAALLAIVVGYFAVHSRGVYMAMLTFAFA